MTHMQSVVLSVVGLGVVVILVLLAMMIVMLVRGRRDRSL